MREMPEKKRKRQEDVNDKNIQPTTKRLKVFLESKDLLNQLNEQLDKYENLHNQSLTEESLSTVEEKLLTLKALLLRAINVTSSLNELVGASDIPKEHEISLMPEEILTLFVDWLQVKDAMSFRLVDTQMKRIVDNNNRYWKETASRFTNKSPLPTTFQAFVAMLEHEYQDSSNEMKLFMIYARTNNIDKLKKLIDDSKDQANLLINILKYQKPNPQVAVVPLRYSQEVKNLIFELAREVFQTCRTLIPELGGSLAHWGVFCTNKKMLRKLKENGYNFTLSGKLGTPLTLACIIGDMRIIQYIATSVGGSINYASKTLSGTPYYYALVNQHYDAAKWLIKYGADYRLLGNKWSKDSTTKSALEFAVTYGDAGFLDFILKEAIGNGDTFDLSALFLYVLTKFDKLDPDKRLGIVTFLLASQQININLADPEGRTALYLAVSIPHLQIVQMIIEHNAVVDVKSMQLAEENAKTGRPEAKKIRNLLSCKSNFNNALLILNAPASANNSCVLSPSFFFQPTVTVERDLFRAEHHFAEAKIDDNDYFLKLVNEVLEKTNDSTKFVILCKALTNLVDANIINIWASTHGIVLAQSATEENKSEMMIYQ